MKHIDIYNIFEDSQYLDTEVTVCGWVRTSRDSKNMAFIELNDGTSLKPVVKPGDMVLYNKYAGTMIVLDNKKYLLLKECDLLAILHEVE